MRLGKPQGREAALQDRSRTTGKEKGRGKERWQWLGLKWVRKHNPLALEIVNKRNSINTVSYFKAPKRRPHLSHLPWRDQRNRRCSLISAPAYKKQSSFAKRQIPPELIGTLPGELAIKTWGRQEPPRPGRSRGRALEGAAGPRIARPRPAAWAREKASKKKNQTPNPTLLHPVQLCLQCVAVYEPYLSSERGEEVQGS